MAFLPFYIAGPAAPRVAILGGGYAGLAALIALRKFCPDANITLVDPRPYHLKITHLHETFRRPLSELQLSYSNLAERFQFRYISERLDITSALLTEWQNNRYISCAEATIDFDYCIVACGAGIASFEKCDDVFDLNDLMTHSGMDILAARIASQGVSGAGIHVIGAGSTGIQFLFEIANFLRARGVNIPLRLIDGAPMPLTSFTPELGRYVHAKLQEQRIEFLGDTFYQGQSNHVLRIERRQTGETTELDSLATFLFVGKSTAYSLEANRFGQVILDGSVQQNLFAVGDCACYQGFGSNSLTAQSALRKGKLVARNLLRHSGRLPILEPYLHRDLGYVISMGPNDAVGWIGMPQNVVAGAPALVVKEIIEAQYDLLLAGIDTFVI